MGVSQRDGAPVDPADSLRLALSQGPSGIEGGDGPHLDPRRVPLGFLELDGDGYVRHFDPAPGAGLVRPEGLHFFREIAPWPQVAEVFPHFVAGVRARQLDVRVRCEAPDGNGGAVCLRFLFSALTRTVWVLAHAEPRAALMAG